MLILTITLHKRQFRQNLFQKHQSQYHQALFAFEEKFPVIQVRRMELFMPYLVCGPQALMLLNLILITIVVSATDLSMNIVAPLLQMHSQYLVNTQDGST